jgi:stress-induced morphogen
MSPVELKSRLEGAFPGSEVSVHDMTGTSNHFEVEISAPQFKGQTRITQQRLVMAAVQAELASGEVHALTMKTTIKESP